MNHMSHQWLAQVSSFNGEFNLTVRRNSGHAVLWIIDRCFSAHQRMLNGRILMEGELGCQHCEPTGSKPCCTQTKYLWLLTEITVSQQIHIHFPDRYWIILNAHMILPASLVCSRLLSGREIPLSPGSMLVAEVTSFSHSTVWNKVY